jgi:hypothetical protein
MSRLDVWERWAIRAGGIAIVVLAGIRVLPWWLGLMVGIVLVLDAWAMLARSLTNEGRDL